MKKHAGTLLTAVLPLLAAGLLFGQARAGELRIGLMPAYNSIPLVVADAAR